MSLIGIDVGGTTIKYGLFTKNGEMKTMFTEPTKERGKQLVEQMSERIRKLENVSAIGLSVPGQVDYQNGIIVHASGNLPFTNKLPLKKQLENIFQLPVHVENDVNAAALGEFHFGLHDKTNDFLFITYGTGVGGAIVSDGKLDLGSHGFAGEFGHIVTHAGGKRCSCGFLGCYEAYASTRVLVEGARKVDATIQNGHDVLQAYRGHVMPVVEVVEAWLDEVAIGLRSLVHSFHPTYLVLGGGIMEEAMLVSLVQNRVEHIVMPSFRPVRVERALLGNKAGMYGAIVPFL